MRVVVAPCAFKGSLSAPQAAAAIARGIALARPDAAIEVLPVADGGDDTRALLVDACGGRLETVVLSNNSAAQLAWLDDTHALVESASVCGLATSESERDPLVATTRWVGELILAALDAGATQIDVALGGTGTVDGGLGALSALGARALGDDGKDVPDGGGGLLSLSRLVLDDVDPRLAGVQLVALCDVDSRLLGARGARMFMAQKGASPEQVDALEDGLAKLGELDDDHFLSMRPGAGAAGGLGFGLALVGAQLVGGAERVLDVLGFDARVAGADLVVTGEGRIDAQTARGKGPAVVARRAHEAGARVIALCGSRADEVPDVFDSVVSLTSGERTEQEAIAGAEALLEDLAATAVPAQPS